MYLCLVVRCVDLRLGLLETLAGALPDRRDPRYVLHTNLDQLRQRVYGIAAGYEDCDDAQGLRDDPMLKVCCGREPEGPALASQPTLSRFENEASSRSCYRLAKAGFGARPRRT